jgi:hypothetical protein
MSVPRQRAGEDINVLTKAFFLMQPEQVGGDRFDRRRFLIYP